MHCTTKALVLRGVDYKESDRILTLLTQDMGKVTVSARGCRKKNSPLSAGCQLLCWSEFVLFQYQGRWTVKECSALREFRGMRTDLEKFALGCYFAEVAELLSVEELPSPELLSLALNSLHALDRLDRPPALVKAAFEWKAMCLAGYEPLLDACAVCGQEEPADARFHLREGVLHCAACRDGVGDGISMPLTPAALAALRHFLWGEPKRLFSVRLDEVSLARLGEASEAYLMTRLERGFRTLDFWKSLQPSAGR